MGQIIYTLWEQGVFSNELTVLKPLVACYKHEMKGKKNNQSASKTQICARQFKWCAPLSIP